MRTNVLPGMPQGARQDQEESTTSNERYKQWSMLITMCFIASHRRCITLSNYYLTTADEGCRGSVYSHESHNLNISKYCHKYVHSDFVQLTSWFILCCIICSRQYNIPYSLHICVLQMNSKSFTYLLTYLLFHLVKLLVINLHNSICSYSYNISCW